ncbi:MULTISPECIES: helix-turn-helix domain-containing protein [unclassified Methylobacterium]|uniref:helix-turn-helix domain-containing protein n=1 Tax=unclassified Methylobacterium TaxID=2615210 RepID=UPI0002F7A395|nr:MULTISPECIES: helix-turn-helix transcriptional regulator [Methylobacterium]WFT83255.1 helix-turn-helix transcriptional regulator [Methylobacterium nodulans]
MALALRGRTKLYAFAAELDVNPSSVTRWVGGGEISTEHAVRICEVLDVSLDWLLLGRGAPDLAADRAISEREARLLATCQHLPCDLVDQVIGLFACLTKHAR